MSAALTLAMLVLAGFAWLGAGWLVGRCGLPVAETLQQGVLLLLALRMAERAQAWVRKHYFSKPNAGGTHG